MLRSVKVEVMKLLFALFLVLSHLSMHGQNIDQQLSEIKTIKQANKFIKSNPTLATELVTFTSVDTFAIAKQLLDKNEGYIFPDQDHTYKIVASETVPLFRVSYVYLDGSKLSKYKIDQLRKEILEKYKAGTSFSELASQYSMDGNAKKGGDLGWFKEGEMAKDFEVAVREHKAGEIFSIDLPENNWFYITLKTHNDREIKTVTVLKIKRGQ